MARSVDAALHLAEPVWGRIRRIAGGRARARVIVLLGAATALSSADIGNTGAIASNLERSLHLSNTQLGLIAAVPAIFAAIGTIPIGVVTDRANRARLLGASIFVWALAMVASGFAQSYEMLLITRVALGIATATSGPPVASLVGDYFAARERARIWGLILSGELIGAGFGYVVSGELATLLSWRYSFFALAVVSLGIALAIWRLLPEPSRGGRSRLKPGAQEFAFVNEDAVDESAAAGNGNARDPSPGQTNGDSDESRPLQAIHDNLAQQEVLEEHVPPREGLVIKRDPEPWSMARAARYVLSIPTNVVLIVASALGYFYFTGVETFGLIYVQGRFHISHSVATLLLGLVGVAALIGVIAGGRLADRLLASGHLNARILISGVAYIVASLLFLPAMLLGSLPFAMLLLIAAGIAFGARNAPLDAARLDIMHHRLWGRAEAVRTFLRQLATAAAPVLFGVLADALGAGGGRASGVHGFGANANQLGIRYAFLILLITLFVGGLLTLRALRSYPRDVATAVASEQATAGASAGASGGAGKSKKVSGRSSAS